MTWLALAAAFVVFIWAEVQDAKISKMYPLYTTGEANRWARNADGYFSMSKSIRNTVIVGAALFAMAFLPWEGVRYGLAGLVGLLGVVWYLSIFKKNRERQLEAFAKQADTLEHFSDTKTVTPMTIKGFRGQWIFSTFYDIRIPRLGDSWDNATERIRAAAVLSERIAKLAGRPELWTRLDRAKHV